METYSDLWVKTEEVLKAKAEGSDDKILIETINIKDSWLETPNYVTVTLANGKNDIYYKVKYNEGLKKFVSDTAQVENIVLNDTQQALYIDDHEKTVEIIKMNFNVRTSYSVSAPLDSSITKEELIDIAEILFAEIK